MNCRVCGGAALTEVADLGSQRLPDFTEYSKLDGCYDPSPSYPLRLLLCESCTLLQLADCAPRDALYHARYGFHSRINEAVRNDLEDIVLMAFKIRPQARKWLDIACNDGTLLSFVPQRIIRAGCDPLLKFDAFAQHAAQHAEDLTPDYFRPDDYGHGEFDVITSVSMFYDLDDPGEFVRGVRQVLARDGIWVIQMNYALDMLSDFAVDNVGHEHVTYFNVRALRRLLQDNGMDIADVTYSAVNGGCFRVVAGHRGAMTSSGSAGLAAAHEAAVDLGKAGTWTKWYGNVLRELEMGAELLADIRLEGQRCYLYGASNRISTVLQLMDPDGKVQPDRAVERNPDKVGKIMASTGIPIISEEEMRSDPPEWLYIGPWFFKDVFMEREKEYLAAGGKMIFPLPRLMVTT